MFHNQLLALLGSKMNLLILLGSYLKRMNSLHIAYLNMQLGILELSRGIINLGMNQETDFCGIRQRQICDDLRIGKFQFIGIYNSYILPDSCIPISCGRIPIPAFGADECRTI